MIYFIQEKDNHKGLIKIGQTSDNVKDRLRTLQTGSPALLQVIGLVNGRNDRIYHQKFAAYKHHGEWFEPADAILDFLEEYGARHVADDQIAEYRYTRRPVESTVESAKAKQFFTELFGNRKWV